MRSVAGYFLLLLLDFEGSFFYDGVISRQCEVIRPDSQMSSLYIAELLFGWFVYAILRQFFHAQSSQ